MSDPISVTITVQGATRDTVQVRDLTERHGSDLVCITLGSHPVKLDMLGTLDDLAGLAADLLGDLIDLKLTRGDGPEGRPMSWAEILETAGMRLRVGAEETP